MKVFLDTSVLLAAALTREGPARELFRQAKRRTMPKGSAPHCGEPTAVRA